MVVFFAEFALRFLIGVEQGVVVLPLDYIFGDPVFEALKMDVLDSTHAAAQTDQRVDHIIVTLETDPT